MARFGYCPSGRIFEAAACGTAVLSDWWEGLDTFFEPGDEILIARSTADTIDSLQMDGNEITRIGARARQRVLDCHTSDIRAREFLHLVDVQSDDASACGERTVTMRGV